MHGRAASQHIRGSTNGMMKLADIPTGIYTSPEISSIGKSDQELTQAKIPYEGGHSQFKSLARAQITGRAIRMLKLLFHSSLEKWGYTIIGFSAHFPHAVATSQVVWGRGRKVCMRIGDLNPAHHHQDQNNN